ncbi:hypothetical protein TTRE_0000135301 [Trichuris trichiura]|uniref:Uncharacterized protein n=1 Tax=Trichuris trichiura TaxID=36087 RepID=A0A077Z316_TRITR|nr:hypothetical protein TTRE_0000135301 [Trichuris trichiura]
MERIQRILKPSRADQHMLDELYDRIGKVETVCNIETCKHLRDPLVVGRGFKEFKEMMKKYDECMDDCRMAVRKEYDLVEELERKEDYWKNMAEIRDEMSPNDAAEYWGQIRIYFKNLDEEEAKYELIKAVAHKERRLENLRRQEAYLRKMEEIRAALSVLDALMYFDEIRSNLEFFN